MVREALSHATPASVDGETVTLDVSESEVHLEGLERSRALVARAISAVTGQRVRVVYRTGSGGEGGAAPAEVQRLDRDADREERLHMFRSRDAALDALADALDLELLE